VSHRVASAWSDGVYHLYVRIQPVGNATYTASGMILHGFHVVGCRELMPSALCLCPRCAFFPLLSTFIRKYWCE